MQLERHVLHSNPDLLKPKETVQYSAAAADLSAEAES